MFRPGGVNGGNLYSPLEEDADVTILYQATAGGATSK